MITWFHVELFRHWNMAEDYGLGDLTRLQGSTFKYSKLLNNLSISKSTWNYPYLFTKSRPRIIEMTSAPKLFNSLNLQILTLFL